MDSGQNSICVFVVYFGKWPKWIPFFLNSCSFNKDIDFIIISESNPCKSNIENVKFVEYSIKDFELNVKQKLGFLPRIKNYGKICDYKPAYGLLFKDLSNNYSYWGYCDIDIVFGDLKNYGVLNKILSSDIFLGYKSYASGPFTIVKNTLQNNKLFTKILNYKDILKDQKLQGMDEHIIKKENCGFSFWKALLFFRFLYHSILFGKEQFKSFLELKYKFQWYVKKNRIKTPVDFTEVLLIEKRKSNMCIIFDNAIKNDSEFTTNKQHNWRILVNGTMIKNMDNDEQYPIFHFRESKYNPDFTCSSMVNKVYTINTMGIF